jgi:hypothetical protein
VQIDPSSNPQMFLTDGLGSGSVNTSITNGSITLLDETTTPNTQNELTYSTITLTDPSNVNIISALGYTTTNDTNTNATRYLTFVDISANGISKLRKDTLLNYNPSTNALTLNGIKLNDNAATNHITNLNSTWAVSSNYTNIYPVSTGGGVSDTFLNIGA